MNSYQEKYAAQATYDGPSAGATAPVSPIQQMGMACNSAYELVGRIEMLADRLCGLSRQEGVASNQPSAVPPTSGAVFPAIAAEATALQTRVGAGHSALNRIELMLP